jgi:hypothetical protein
MMRRPRTSFILTVGLLIALLAPSRAGAQASKSSALAKELAAALDGRKLGAIAAKIAGADDRFAAALYFSGSQLLVISARYTPPEILNERLAKKEYREIYMDLNQASLPASRISIEDFGADGLISRKGGGPADTVEQGGSKPMAFDGDWGKQQLTEDAYQKSLASADDQYAQILTALLAEAKKGS